MDKRLYPISAGFFESEIKPLIEKCYSCAGRPQKVSDYQVFNAELIASFRLKRLQQTALL